MASDETQAAEVNERNPTVEHAPEEDCSTVGPHQASDCGLYFLYGPTLGGSPAEAQTQALGVTSQDAYTLGYRAGERAALERATAEITRYAEEHRYALDDCRRHPDAAAKWIAACALLTRVEALSPTQTHAQGANKGRRN